MLSSPNTCGSVVLVLIGLLPQSILLADDAMERIAHAWTKHYGRFAQGQQYHYQCVLTQRRKKADLTWNQVQLPEDKRFGVEVFRLDPASRMDVISGGDFSAIHESEWTQIFDGRAGFSIDRAGQHVTIYSASRDMDQNRKSLEPAADPLADVLGLATSRAGSSFGLGVGWAQDEFDVPRALAGGRFQVTSEDTKAVELVDAAGNRFTLSVPHNYAVVRRSWICDPGTAARGFACQPGVATVSGRNLVSGGLRIHMFRSIQCRFGGGAVHRRVSLRTTASNDRIRLQG